MTDIKGFFKAICPNGIKGCDQAPDYLAIHVYALEIDSLKSQVEAYHNDFGIDIVITEYACNLFGDNPPQVTVDQASKFMSTSSLLLSPSRREWGWKVLMGRG